jgi:hypothetical protein
MRFGVMHDRDQAVAGLRAEGYSFRTIAKIQGMSLAGVQRALRRAELAPVDLDADDGALHALPLDDGDPPVGSVRFVGVDERVELFTDERGKRFDLLDVYRHGRVDGGALFRDACEQLEASRRRLSGQPSENFDADL